MMLITGQTLARVWPVTDFVPGFVPGDVARKIILCYNDRVQV